MTPERWAQIRRIFDGALDRPEQDRSAWLRRACGDDGALRKEVEALLLSHSSPDFLDRPAADLQRALLSSQGTSGTLRAPGYPPEDDEGEYKPGFQVGTYELQKQIGRGGMGSVWLAHRFGQDFSMAVAIKVVKRGMDSQEVLRRFRLERQVLAGLDHPNIARLLDGGSTAEGLPYLVMEYVEGIRVDHYCEGRQLSISDRLLLFRQICSAVQYAHQNLVVHRDIKASNVLVTTGGSPKLLDFGIAKVLRSDPSTPAAAETRVGVRPMTVDYASPEQVRGESITVATDVYSLGVLLYKLMTGKFPYGPGTHNQTVLEHAICDVEAIKPSSVILSDSGTAVPQPTQQINLAETRLKARRRLKKKLAGDLDSIILKALRKEPRARYASVEEFSQDLRRYLEGRPVRARKDTFGYRAAKFLRRNPWKVAAAAAVFMAFVISLASAGNDARRLGGERTALEVQFNAAREAAIRQQIDLANAYFRLGAMEARQGDGAGALASYRSAGDAARRFAKVYPDSPLGYLTLAGAAVRIGDLAPAEARDRYEEALAQYDLLAAQSYKFRPEELRERMAIARRLGLVQFSRRDYSGALETFRGALAIAEQLQDRRLLAAAHYHVAKTLALKGEARAAVDDYRTAFDAYRDLAGRDLPGVSAPASATSAENYERALADLAAAAPVDLRAAIESDLAAFARALRGNVP